MQIINRKIDFLFIKFPIILPVIYYLIISYFPSYEIYVIFFTILFLAEPHFAATWPHFFSSFEKNYINSKKINFIYLPLILIFFCIIGFFFFTNVFYLIFLAANMYHVTRQSVGISKLYKRSENQIIFEENLIYIFNILFFIIGFFRFFYPIIQPDQIQIINLIILSSILIIFLYFLYKNGFNSNSFTLLSGILIFYPICFVTNPVHAILMGVTMHYSQYLVITFRISKKKNNDIYNQNFRKDYFKKFLFIVILYSLIMTTLSYFGKNDFEFLKNLILIPIIGQMLHFFIDSQIWKFSDPYIRKNVLKYLI